jgi:hypothetical protein
MTRWQALHPHLGTLAGKIDAMRPPLLLVEVDGVTALVVVCPSREALAAHARFPGMPTVSLESWLEQTLGRVAQHYPEPTLLLIYGQWPALSPAEGPPKREQLARVRPRTVPADSPSAVAAERTTQ